ncbi:MAG: DUF1273 family protein [Clostridia bacterium]|nr:DUF1273 family protein [Clostridia bacterium]
MSREKTCCFTGHRHLYSSYKAEDLKNAIETMVNKGVTIFIAGGALGFDTEAAIEVLRLKKKNKDIELHIYAPCNDQSKLWTLGQKMLYKKILKHADYVDMPSHSYNNQCMKIRNYKMVDNSAYLIAYYDGSVRSGTGQTFRYAQKCGLGIINICKEEAEEY